MIVNLLIKRYYRPIDLHYIYGIPTHINDQIVFFEEHRDEYELN